MKNLLVCCDGTWEYGEEEKTNARRFYELAVGGEGQERVYFKGVGNGDAGCRLKVAGCRLKGRVLGA